MDDSGEVVTTESTAARYVGERAIDVAPVAQLAPGPGEVRIDVAFTGICGTDLHIVHGDMDQRVTVPAVLGHEMSGRIAEIGPGVTTWSVGDPVTVMPLEWCGTCPACLAGHQHICHRLIFVGIDSPGAMQSSWTVPSRILVRLPYEISLRDAALVEPTAVAVHDVRRAQLSPGERVLVVGGGPVGLLVAVVAREVGGEILVLEVDAHRRSVIAELGFDVLDPTTDDVAGHLEAWTEGAGVPLAFEVSGSQPGLDTAIDALAVRGRLVVVAIHPQARPVSLFRLFWRELTVIGARVYERADYERAVDLVAAGVVPADALISAVVALSEAADAFVQLERGGGVMKVLIDCRASADA
jgi:(R,R)-butanediol dehydrogenase / meso-butanediol dehydrogenase / diacetyl reductase